MTVAGEASLTFCETERHENLDVLGTAQETAALPPGFADLLDVAFGCQFVEVTTRFHPFVQNEDALDRAFLGDAMERT